MFRLIFPPLLIACASDFELSRVDKHADHPIDGDSTAVEQGSSHQDHSDEEDDSFEEPENESPGCGIEEDEEARKQSFTAIEDHITYCLQNFSVYFMIDCVKSDICLSNSLILSSDPPV